MKKLIIALFLLPMFASSQTYQAMPQAGYGPVKRMLFDSVLTLPLNILKLQNATGGRDMGQIRYNVSDSSIYIYSGSRWIKSGIDTSTIYYNLGLKLNISDTAQMMTAAPRVNRFLDSIAALKNSLALKLNISDTSTMLAAYTRATQTALKLNISDTAGMLSAYTRLAANALKLNISDTAAMMAAAPRVQRFLDSVANLKSSIALKVNISDTSAMLTPYLRDVDTTGKFITSVFRKAASDSVFFVKGGANNFAYKDSAGGANIGNTNLTLTGARTLTLNSQPLDIAGTTSTRFFANGRITIGGITDAGYRLDVIGEDARFNGVRVGKGNGGLTNTVIGNNALNTITSGASNTGVGLNALERLTTGQQNTAVGQNALQYTTTTSFNTAVGLDAGLNNSSNQCTVIGNIAMRQVNTGEGHTYVGYQAGRGGSGTYNTGVGAFALLNTNGGAGNAVLGVQSFNNNVTGNFNSGLGFQSAFNTTGTLNTAIGAFSIFNNIGGSNNTVFGYNAGRFITGGVTPATVVNNSILIGYGVKVAANTETNQIVIGYDATGLGSNTTVIGNASTTTTGLYGNLRMTSGMATAPASATAAGTVGDVRITAGFIYVCTATNTWVRTALTSW